MRFEVLGPPRVVDATGSVVPPGRRQHELVLACLLAAGGRTVADSTLMTALWGHDPSDTRHGALRVLVHHLRRRLGTETILRATGGYRVVLDGHRLDTDEFSALVDAAARDEARGRLPEAREHYRAALRLWRGAEAYQGTADIDLVRAAADHLAEQRMTAYESCVDIELSLGLHRELCAELSAVAGQNPLRERLQAQLMLALVRSDRRAEALAVYERTRRILVDELGADPGTRLQQLYAAILREAAPAVVPSAASVVVPPAQLPAPPSTFVGRQDELAALDAVIGTPRSGRRISGSMVVTGSGGMGKTALVTRWAHRHRESFPGGQLYLDLDNDVPATVAVARALVDLGVAPDDVPPQAEARAARLRSLLSGRTVLMVLDNVSSAEQARPFLPGSGDSALVIISRNRLDGLVARDGAHPLVLTPLPVEPATRLLQAIAGTSGPVTGDIRTLVALCHGLPLAIRIVGAHLRLGARPGALVVALQDERTRLARLTTSDGDVNVRATIALSYRRLAAAERQLLRRLGLSDAHAIPPGAVAALAGISSGAVLTDLIGRLATANLVAVEADNRISIHQLTRIFAREQGHFEDPSADRASAERQLLRWYGQALGDAQRRIRPAAGGAGDRTIPDPRHVFLPDLPDTAAAVRWVDKEADTIAGLIARFGRTHPDLVWPLAADMRGWLQRRASRDTWIAVTEQGVRSAALAGSTTGEATLYGSLGVAHSFLLHRAEARAAYERAGALFGRSGDDAGRADVEASLGAMLADSGALDDALPPLLRARQLGALLDDPDLIFKAELNLGYLHRRADRQQDAFDAYTAALTAAERSTDRDWLAASVHTNLGRLHLLRGDVDRAGRHYDTAVRLARSTGDRLREAWALHGCSDVAAERRDIPAAVAALGEAVTILEPLGDRRLDEMRGRLSELLSFDPADSRHPPPAEDAVTP
ncbi:BTAD domain-containing putative transcriptional regulator [Micromonospora chaiyaphumensis]|uniref:DNA-binding transcriptional activator of the SARP family n=1 Tax=Micromonospora chaiyaphumensis TaxID=307119 RepID=A0A1C4UTN7_9ACTN|nr:BTAD domain-containing putative transcriptional regulator [Micromonospora chaiyaphumensis]SCE75011.1 DNA-binding transcriptional activator of the SARP family [Micromonospora chaiyaphumensis]